MTHRREPARVLTGLIAVIVLWLAAAAAAFAGEHDLVVERAWLEDPGGLLTWEQVRERPMAPLRGVLSRGYGDAPVWIRLRVDPGPSSRGAESLFVRIRPMYLDEVTLFDPLQEPPGRPPVGDRHPVSGQAEPSTTFLYAVPAGDGPRDLWLRVRTTSTRLVHAEVLTPAELRLSGSRLDHLGALYIGLIAMFFLWGVVQVLLRPERLMVAFIASQAIALLTSACWLGYPYLYLSDDLAPGVIDTLTSASVVLQMLAGIAMSHLLLEELGPARWRRRAMLALCAVFPVLLGMMWAGYVGPALHLNMAMLAVAPVLMLAFALASRVEPREAHRRRALSKPVLVGYFGAMLGFAGVTAAPSLGLLKAPWISLYASMWHGLSGGALMVLMLQYRAWQNLRQQSLLRIAAFDAARLAEQERAHREDRERLLQMLGHELKTPLSTMRMLLADRDVPAELSKRIGAGVNEMAGVLERTVQAGRVEADRATLAAERADLLQVLRTVCGDLPGGERVRLRLRTDAEGGAPVCTDLTLLRGVLRNLLENALKYGAPGEPVDVEIAPRDERGRWGVLVADAPGRAGLPDAQRVFQKYYRSPRAGYCSGSGLGLYLVRGLVRQMGGEVRYEPEGGTVRFRVLLPDLPEETP